MNIQARCETCGRTFLLSQIGEGSDAPGRCPFCGVHFARQYSTLLIGAVREAERSAAEFAHALGRLGGMDAGFVIDSEGLLRELSERLARDSNRAAG